MFWLLTISLATASPSGWYHPDAVATQSVLFKQLTDGLMPRFEKLERDLAVTGAPLIELDRAVLILGSRAPTLVSTYADGLRKRAAHARLQSQALVDAVQEDSAVTFGGALERAKASVKMPESTELCQPLTGIAALNAGARSAKSCEGESWNERLVESLDKDPALVADVEEMLAVPWPSFELSGEVLPTLPFTGEDGYIAVGAVANAFLEPALEELRDDLGADLEGLLDEPEANNQERRLAKAEALRAAYEQDVSRIGAGFLTAVETELKKRKVGVRLCANPVELGGCEGTDRTASTIETLQKSKRFMKSIR